MLHTGDAVDLHIGTTIEGRYVVDGLLGEGGTARVWRVRHARLGTLHALKALHLATPALRERMLLEGKVQGTLRHPHIVAVTDVVDVGGYPGLVMELVDGPSLARLLKSGRPTVAQVDQLARGILQGVAAAHAAGLVHRDLKPANILLSIGSAGIMAKVTDFGLAKVLMAEDPSMTRSGVTMGSPLYMSPEQVRDAKRADKRSDVFSLGVVLYEMLTGEVPFQGEDVFALFECISQGTYTPPQDLVPDLPERMARAIEVALQVDPEARFGDAGALLDAWTEGESDHATVWPVGDLDLARSLGAASPPVEPAGNTTLSVGMGTDTEAPTPPEAAPPHMTLERARRPAVPDLRVLAGVVVIVALVGLAVLAPRSPHAPTTFTAAGAPTLSTAWSTGVLQQAWAALLRAEPQLAGREAKRLLDSDPDSAEARVLLYVALILQGREGSAEQLLHDPALPESGESPSARLIAALREGGDAAQEWQEAHPDDLLGAAVFRGTGDGLVASHPELPLAWLLAARQRSRERDHEGAEEALIRAEALSPGAAWLGFERARILIDRGALDEAHELLVSVLQQDPGLVAARARLAVVLRHLDRAEEASSYAAALRDRTVAPDQQVDFAQSYAVALLAMGAIGEARDLVAWGMEVAERAGLWSDLARLALVTFTLEDLAGTYPPPEAILDRIRRLAATPDLADRIRTHLQTALLMAEGEAAVSAGDLAQAEAIEARLRRLGARTKAARVRNTLHVARGDIDALPEPGACLHNWLTYRAMQRHGQSEAARPWLEASVLPEACRDTNPFERAAAGMAAAELASLALARGDREGAADAIALARRKWLAPDPDHFTTRQIAVVEAALAGAAAPPAGQDR